MLGLMKRDLVVAGKAIGGAGLTGAVLYLVATAPTHVHVYWPYWLFLAAVLVGVGLYFAGQERSPATSGNNAPIAPIQKQASPAVTDRWQLTVNKVSSEMLQLQNNSINHPGYMRRSTLVNPPSSVRIGMMVACGQLGGAASTSHLRAKFLRFLGQPPVMDLVRELTEIGEGVIWTARDDNPPFNFGAVLAPPDTEEALVAWARLLLPDSLTQQYGRDARCAYLVLYAEPRTGAGTPPPAASLLSWYQRLTGALKLPASLAAFLLNDLGLPTADDPAAEVGVWLKAPQSLTELIEVDAFNAVAGSPQTNWFMGFAIASPDGEQAPGTALAWLRQMCDSSLHLEDYESALPSEPTSSVAGPPSPAEPVPDTGGRPGQRPAPGRWKMPAAWAAGVTALVAALIGAYVASGSHRPVSGSHGSSMTIARVYSAASYGFDAPNRIAADSNHVWVTNPPGNSVTELNARDGSWVATLTGASHGFDGPVGIADDGTHVWVANTSGNSVTELDASDGSWVRTLTGASYSFGRPYAIADDGTHVWVVNNSGNSVTELDASDGSLVRNLNGASYSFSYPVGIADDGTHVWVANATGNSVTELDASDGSLVRNLNGASYSFSSPRAIALDGTHVWVANATGNSVTELNASDGSWVTTLNGPSYGFYGPWGMAANGMHVWVTNSGGNSVTELTVG